MILDDVWDFFFSSRRRHTRFDCDWSSDVCSSDLVEAALDEGITTFDTADVYAGTRAEEVLGRALRGVRRESLEIFTKVYWPTGPGPNEIGRASCRERV